MLSGVWRVWNGISSWMWIEKPRKTHMKIPPVRLYRGDSVFPLSLSGELLCQLLQQFPGLIVLCLVVGREGLIGPDHGMLSGRVIPQRTVAPVIHAVKPHPALMLDPAADFFFLRGETAVACIGCPAMLRGDGADGIILQQNADFGQQMTGGRDIGLTLKFRELLPVRCISVGCVPVDPVQGLGGPVQLLLKHKLGGYK